MFKNKKIKLPVLALAAVAAAGLIAGTWAYFYQDTTFNNQVDIGDYNVDIKENFNPPGLWLPGEETQKVASVTNKGTTPVLVRMKLEAESISSSGEAEELGTTFTHNFNVGDVITEEVYNSLTPPEEQQKFDQNGDIYTCNTAFTGHLYTVIKHTAAGDYQQKPSEAGVWDYYYYHEILAPGATTSALQTNLVLNPFLTHDTTETTETIHDFIRGTSRETIENFINSVNDARIYKRVYATESEWTDQEIPIEDLGTFFDGNGLIEETLFVLKTADSGNGGAIEGSRYSLKVKVETVQATKEAMMSRWLNGLEPNMADGIVRTLYDLSSPI